MTPANRDKAIRTGQDDVLTEQVEAIYSQLPNLSLGNVLGTLILIAIYRDMVAPVSMWGWTLLNLSLVLLTYPVLVHRYRRRPVGQNPRRWLRAAVLMGTLRALVWGSIPLAFAVPGSLQYELVNYVFVLVGVGMALLHSAPHRLLFFGSVPAMLMPVTILFVLQGSELTLTLAVGNLFYWGLLHRMFGRLHAMLLQNIRLKHRSSALATQLEVQKNAAEEADAAKSRFLATASHDLRQPLQAQILFTEELAARVQDGPAREVLERLQRSVSEMRTMFDELLDISRLEARSLQPKPRRLAIQKLIDGMTSELEALAQEKHIDMRVVRSSACVRSDPALLTRILRNLLSNAVQHTASGRVLVGCRRRGPWLRLEVHDTGPGIPAAEQSRIFGEFYRLDAGGGGHRGLGLGLAIVQRLCPLLGCHLELSSRPGRGSCFCLLIPRARCPSPVERRQQRRAPGDDLAGRRLLLIDDDPEILRALAGTLDAWSCDVATADSLEQALARLETSWTPELVIADYHLGGGETGTEAIRALRERLQVALPAVLLTADAGARAQREALALDVELLHKPVAPARLRALLAYILSPHYRPPARRSVNPG